MTAFTGANRPAQALALGAMGLVVIGAAALGIRSGRDGAPGAAGLAPFEAIEAGADHLAPADLADRLMRGQPMVVVDVRPEEELAAGFRLPGSIRLSLPELLSPRGEAAIGAPGPQPIVLCSNGPAHPGQAWVELARRGYTGARVLDGGLEAFKAAVLTPPSLRGATPEERAKLEAPLFAARRAFFLGPAPGDPRAPRHGTYATDPAGSIEAPTVVSARWLAGRLGGVVVLDARESAAEYGRVRIPGARHLPPAAVRAKTDGKPHLLLPPAEIARRLGALGIAPETAVVIYAEDKLQDATFVALALLGAGHERVGILEGGLLAWCAERRPVEIDAPAPAVAPREHPLRAPPEAFAAQVEDVARAVRERSARVLDVRTAPAFRGEQSTEARPGHIPGSLNRELSRDSVRFAGGHFWQPREDLLAAYERLGLRPDAPLIVSCRTGHQASASTFVLRHLLGYRDVRWYNGSWTEWAARADLPAELGDARP